MPTGGNKVMKYDVVVVGSGPGGCMTAKRLAELGINVLLIEKRPEIGVPVRCAEATGIKGLKELGIKLDKRYIASVTRGAYVFSPDGTKKSRTEIIAENMQMGPRYSSETTSSEKTSKEENQKEEIPKEEIPVIEMEENPPEENPPLENENQKTEDISQTPPEDKGEVNVKDIPFFDYFYTPDETKKIFKDRGDKYIVIFDSQVVPDEKSNRAQRANRLSLPVFHPRLTS